MADKEFKNESEEPAVADDAVTESAHEMPVDADVASKEAKASDNAKSEEAIAATGTEPENADTPDLAVAEVDAETDDVDVADAAMAADITAVEHVADTVVTDEETGSLPAIDQDADDNVPVTLPIIDTNGKKVGDYDIDVTWIERCRGKQAVHDTVVAYLAGQREGTAATKNRARVRGSGAKPWRQKGTGRARAGSRKSPIWRGGGVAFGPSPRDYSKKTNKKVRQLALRRAFTSKIDEEAVIIADTILLSEPKTKKMVQYLDTVGAGEHCLVVVKDYENVNVILAASNLPYVELIQANCANVYQILLYDRIIFTKDALDIFGSRLT